MIKIQIHHLLSFVSIFIVYTFFFSTYAYASVYTVSPLVINHDLEKRDVIEEKITLTNKDSHMVQIFPTVNEVSVNEGGEVHTFVQAVETDRTNAISSWLEISRAQIELMPNETKEITLTIRVNPEVKPGEYNAFIGFPEGSNRPEAEKLVFDNQAPGTVVRIGIDKVQNQFLRLEQFSVERFIKNTSEGEIKLVLQNPGEDSVIPKGEIIFYDNSGIEAEAIPLNDSSVVVEGKKSVSFDFSVPKDLPMGKYKAFLSVEYGEHQTASLNDTAFFYVIPLKPVLAVFFIVLLCAMGIALYVHKQYDRDEDTYGATNVALYVRTSRSESKDHDIDLSKKNEN